MSLLKVGGPSPEYYPEQQQEQMPAQHEEIIPPEANKTEIDTPIGKLTFGDWFGVASICIIILVVGIVKKYLWNSSKDSDKK